MFCFFFVVVISLFVYLFFADSLLITCTKFGPLSCISVTIILPSTSRNSKLLSQFSFTNKTMFLVIYFSLEFYSRYPERNFANQFSFNLPKVFACSRLVYMRHVTQYAPAKDNEHIIASIWRESVLG